VDQAVAALTLKLGDADFRAIEAAYLPRATRAEGH